MSAVFQRRMDHLAVARQHGGLDDFVVPFRREGRVLAGEQRQEGEQVLGVERGGVGGDAARQVGEADDRDAVDDVRLVRLSTAGSCRPG